MDKIAGVTPFYGLCVGWLGVWLLAAHAPPVFAVHPLPDGIPSYCVAVGYPKIQDYVWFALTVLGAWGGAVAAVVARRAFAARGGIGRRDGSWPVAAGFAALAASGLAARSPGWNAPWVTLPLAVLGVGLPWLARSFSAPGAAPVPADPPGPRRRGAWTFGAVAAAALWLADPCLSTRNLDGLHEGEHLLYVQQRLAGDLPGLDLKATYDPLFLGSEYAVVRAAGCTVLADRWYFLGAQILGTALHLAVIVGWCAGLLARLTGGWLILTASTACMVLYGWANALRTGLPLAALGVLWVGTAGGRRAAFPAAGVLLGLAGAYSAEYAVAAGLASLVALAGPRTNSGPRDGRGAAADAAAWALATAAAYAGALVAVEGFRAVELLHRPEGGVRYGLERLLGHMARPAPALQNLGTVLSTSAVWRFLAWYGMPACAAGAAGAWLLARGRADAAAVRLASATVFALFAEVPAVVRPMTQIASSAPGAILVVALLVDGLGAGGRRARALAGALGVAAAVFGASQMASIPGFFGSKVACLGRFPEVSSDPLTARLGLQVPESRRRLLSQMVSLIHDAAPPGRRIYLAAPESTILAFLADRACVTPYAVSWQAVTAADRRAAVAALERERPPIAFVAPGGMEVPYAVEHPEEAAWLAARYRRVATLPEFEIWMPPEVAKRFRIVAK